jgi:hypothetical protein
MSLFILTYNKVKVRYKKEKCGPIVNY